MKSRYLDSHRNASAPGVGPDYRVSGHGAELPVHKLQCTRRPSNSIAPDDLRGFDGYNFYDIPALQGSKEGCGSRCGPSDVHERMLREPDLHHCGHAQRAANLHGNTENATTPLLLLHGLILRSPPQPRMQRRVITDAVGRLPHTLSLSRLSMTGTPGVHRIRRVRVYGWVGSSVQLTPARPDLALREHTASCVLHAIADRLLIHIQPDQYIVPEEPPRSFSESAWALSSASCNTSCSSSTYHLNKPGTSRRQAVRPNRS